MHFIDTWSRTVAKAVLPGLVLLLFGAQGTPAPTAQAQNAPSVAHGVYVYSEHLQEDSDALAQSLNVPGVDGLTLLVGWASIEPDQGNFDWSTLDRWIGAAAASNKQVALAIRAGQDTPCWLFQAPSCGAGSRKTYAGATSLTFSVSPREGIGQAVCNTETIAAPWDPVFLSQWDQLLAAVAGHLAAAGTYGIVSSLRLTGINRTTSELRLPAEILTTPCVTNSVQTWLTSSPPFSPSALLSAWDQVTGAFLKSFPDKGFGAEVIPTASGDSSLEYPFPAIDDMGCAYQPPWPASSTNPNYVPGTCVSTAPVPDQNMPLLTLTSQKMNGRLSLSYQNLDLRQPASPYVVQSAQALGAAIGFQTNDYDHLQRAACSGGSASPGPCNAASYLKLLEVGIYPLGQKNSLRAQYIEVLPPDAIAFPSAVARAHAELTAGL
jgi:hypothetical protein